jgi:hypothetical protein
VTRSTHGRSMFNEAEATLVGRITRGVKPVTIAKVSAMKPRRSIFLWGVYEVKVAEGARRRDISLKFR